MQQNARPNSIKMLPTDTLEIDKTYQRQLSPKKIGQIMEKWMPDAAGVILVSRRVGRFYVVDGQHRVAAAQRLGIPEVLCQIVDDLDVPAEAYRFYLCNTARAAPDARAVFRARLRCGEEIAVEVCNIVEQAGYNIQWYRGTTTNYEIAAVGACETVYRGLTPKGQRFKKHPSLLKTVLETITLAWDGAPGGVHGRIIQGLAKFYMIYSADIPVGEVATKLEKISPLVIRREASSLSMGTIHPAHVARVILKYVNYRRASHNRLPDKIVPL